MDNKQVPRDSHHHWHDPAYVSDWISSDRTRDGERIPKLRKMVSLIPWEQDKAIRILDVGAGYGLLSQVVLETFPEAQLVWHDFSEAMLSHTQEILKGFSARISWVISDLSRSDWSKDLPGPFDAVVSAIAIHNLQSPERIASIYRELLPLIKKGGCFLNMERVGSPGDITGRFYQRARLEESGELVARGSGAREGFRSPSLESHLHWLKEAGFDEVDVFWKEMGQAIIGAYRLSTDHEDNE